MKMTGAEIFCESLRREGVKTIFGLPGGVVLKIFDVLCQQKGLDLVLTRHEQGAAHMAEGYAKATGRAGVVLVTSGPGMAAYKDEASSRNEQNTVKLADDRGRRLQVVQVAGVVARRIVSRVYAGQQVLRGERFGLIMFGSRTDTYLPGDCKIEVAEGQRVKGGETILARFV